MMATYDQGDIIRLGNHSTLIDPDTGVAALAFKNAAGVDTDPTGVTLTVRKTPSGAVTTYTFGGTPALTKETTGRYYVDVAIDQEGTWFWELAGTGTVQTARVGSFHVRRRMVAA